MIVPNFINSVFTYVLTSDTLTIKAEDGVNTVQLRLVSGTVTYKGDMKIGNINSIPVPLLVGDPVIITMHDAIDKLIIDASAGSVQIIAHR